MSNIKKLSLNSKLIMTWRRLVGIEKRKLFLNAGERKQWYPEETVKISKDILNTRGVRGYFS